MDKVFWALPLLFILTQEGLLASTSTAGPSSSSSTSCQGESKNIHFKLTSKDPDATIELKKLIVSEKKGGKEVDEYIIDLTEKRVFLDKDPQSRNQLDVEKSSDASLFTVDSMSCGGNISAPCGHTSYLSFFYTGKIFGE